MRPGAGWNSFWSLFLYQRLDINSNTSCAKFLRENLSTCKVKYILANQTLAWRAECLSGFPLSKRCTSWSKPGQVNGAPIRPLHASQQLTAPPPLLSSLVAWLPSPFVVRVRWLLACLLDYLLQARLPLSHGFLPLSYQTILLLLHSSGPPC